MPKIGFSFEIRIGDWFWRLEVSMPPEPAPLDPDHPFGFLMPPPDTKLN
jgi:hypothetical protein